MTCISPSHRWLPRLLLQLQVIPICYNSAAERDDIVQLREEIGFSPSAESANQYKEWFKCSACQRRGRFPDELFCQ